MGDDVEQLDPLGGIEAVAVAEEAEPLARRRPARARATARLSSWASGTQKFAAEATS